MATLKTVLITGASRGIGLRLAECYVALGWRVIGTARNLNKADQLRALSPFKIVQLDIANEASILSAAKELEGEAIDLLVNNAGVFVGGDLDTTTKEGMLRQFEVNAVGPFLVTRAFMPHLKAGVAKNGGTAYVVQISSRVGSIALNNGAFGTGYYGYSTSKAALNMVNASLALDIKGHGIAAVALHPGYVATDLNEYKGVISTETSVNGLVSVIDKLTLADAGKFYDYIGESLPW